MTVRLGYEVGSGHPVNLQIHHLIITGLTQLAGKTTTLEALIARSGRRAIAFRTKRGEIGFDSGKRIRPFFRERSDWQYVQALLEATMRERMKFERSWIIKVTKGARDLQDVHRNVLEELETARGLSEGVYTNLNAYLELVLPQIQAADFATELALGKRGLHIMDLEGLSPEMQALVIQSTMDRVMEHHKDVVVIVPEAWHFIPQRRGNPVKWAAERFIRMGAVLQNYLWLDSQDIAGVDKSVLKSVSVWILGRQQEFNEVKRTIAQLPVPASRRPKPEEVMGLPVGHFFATIGDDVVKVYVQPAWLSARKAKAVALGKEIPKQVKADLVIGESKPREAQVPEVPVNQEEEEMVWKERYEKLEKQYDEMRIAHGLLNAEGIKQKGEYEERIREQRASLDALLETEDSLRKELEDLREDQKAFSEVREVFRQFFGGASPDDLPGGATEKMTARMKTELAVVQEVPDLEIERKVVQVKATGQDHRGRLALLISEGVFNTAVSAGEVATAFATRAWPIGTGTLYGVLDWFTATGFLRKTNPGKKKAVKWEVIPEAKKRIQVRDVQVEA